MLVQPNREMLGDSHLNEHEGLTKIKEENQKLTDRQKMAGQAELEDPDRVLGSRLSYREIVRRLQKLNLNIKVVDGSAGNVAIYILKTNQELAESYLEDSGDNTRHAWHKMFKYVTGCPKESLPEFSGVILDERGVAKRELRGWRSILIAMVKNRAITYKQAEEAFGPALGSRSWRYEAQLQQYKQ